jgi:hypothetical protein
VSDVEASSRWYQWLLGCQSAHGGTEYERLVSNGVLVLQLHRFDVEHQQSCRQTLWQSVLLCLEIDDFDAAVARAVEMKADIFTPRHRNPPTGGGGPSHWEIWLFDPDGYIVVLASPDDSAR